MKLRRHRKRLSRPAAKRKAKSQTAAIVHKLRHDLTAPSAASGAAAAHSVTQLRTTIAAVKQDVHVHGAGRHTSLVSSALGDLDHGLQTMAKGFAATDPNETLLLLAKAKRSIDQAQGKARRAGHDWPL
ncbi:MAG: hypothetical protein ACRDMJ_01425 [Solirubrobacteraceae bacterium]